MRSIPSATALFFCLIGATSHCAELQGTVVEVVGADVKIRVAGQQVPNAGDLVRIGSKVPGVGFVALEGTWKVTAVEGGFVKAQLLGTGSGKPAPAMAAIITTSTVPGQAETKAATAPRPAAPVHAGAPTDADRKAEGSQPAKPRYVVRPPVSGPPSKDTRALERAVQAKDAEQTAKLLQAGADPNYAEFGNWSLLMNATRLRSPEITKQLLAAGANPNTAITEAKEAGGEGKTPLMSAAGSGSPECVRLLLDAGAKVNAKTNGGATALVLAGKSGNAEAIQLLLQAGADVNAATTEQDERSGRTALIEATRMGSTKSVALLIQAKANVNQAMTGKRYAGYTALRAAAHFGHLPIVQLLLKAGADPNIATTGSRESSWIGYTPLHSAVKQNHPSVVKALLDAGADPNIACASGKTPIQLTKRAEIVQLLQDAMKKPR